MPDPIVAFSTVRFLWNETKPVRNWLWSKLPFAQDAKKKEAAEALLATLLEDANKLNRSLAPDQADEAIDKRIEQFRKDLLTEKIPADQVDTFVERGALFIKMLVTGPMGETAALRERVGMLEETVQKSERALERLEAVASRPDRSQEFEIRLHKLSAQLVIAWVVAAAAVLVAIIALVLALRPGH